MNEKVVDRSIFTAMTPGQQQQYFAKFGLVLLPQIISAEQIERIAKEISRMRYVQADKREAVLREAYENIFGEEEGTFANPVAQRDRTTLSINMLDPENEEDEYKIGARNVVG